MADELTHAERQRDRRNRLHEIGREIIDIDAKMRELNDKRFELFDELRRTEAALLELPTGQERPNE